MWDICISSDLARGMYNTGPIIADHSAVPLENNPQL